MNERPTQQSGNINESAQTNVHQKATTTIIEELRHRNELLRNQVITLMDEADRLRQQLKDSDQANEQLLAQLSGIDGTEMADCYSVWEL